jgi:plastocyanin
VSRLGHWKVRGPASNRGAGLLPFVVVSVVLGACQGPGTDAEVRAEEEARALGLPAGAELHRVTLGGRGAREHAVPTRIQAFPGDGVEFRSVDYRIHTLQFVSDSLSEAVRTFLETTGQIASPPLVTRGSRFILNLQNAPQGRYFFMSEGHGGTAFGVVEVGIPPEADSSRAAQY